MDRVVACIDFDFLVDGYLSMSAPEVINGVFNSTWHSGPKSKSDYSNSIATFLGNLLFLQTIIVPVFGTNGPLWSLANEFWYYVLFPLLAVVTQSTGSDRKISRRLLAAGIAALVLLFLPIGILIGFLIWLSGVAVFWISAKCSVKARPTALITCGALFAASLAYSKSERWQTGLGVNADLVVGLAFAALCLIMSTWPNPLRSRFGIVQTKIYEAMSDFSYSLYLSHFPFVVVIGAMYYGEGKVIPALGSLLVYLLWLLVLMVFAFIFWSCFERHTDYCRRVLTKRMVGQE